jgi:hypothetical protein
MPARLLLIYGLCGPIVGALIYVAMSALAAVVDLRPDIFIEPRFFSATLARTFDLALWQILISAPLTLAPALLTGGLTLRRMRQVGSCPWWLSCVWGGATSGVLALLGLSLAHVTGPWNMPIPPIMGGSALIALIGFLGTIPCWGLVAAMTAQVYRSSPQNR